MTGSTEPSNHQRLAVVVVVHLTLGVVASLAGLAYQLPAAQVDVGVAPGVIAESLFR